MRRHLVWVCAALIASGCIGEITAAEVTDGTSPGLVQDGSPSSNGPDGSPVRGPGDGRGQGQGPEVGQPAQGEEGGTVEAEPLPARTCADGGPALVDGLTISEVSIYQAVKIPLAVDGRSVGQRNARVVQGREALVRAFVEPSAGWSPHAVTAVLTVDNGGQTRTYEDTRAPQGASTDGDPDSTFNFFLEGADITPSTTYSVELLEEQCPSTVGSPDDARFPSQGREELGAQATGTLRVVLVPVRYTGEGGPTVARADDTVVRNMRDAFMEHYPVPDVEVTVRSQPVTFSGNMTAQGGGWSALLDVIRQTRDADEPDSDVYYYGLIEPASSFQGYCRFGCVAGIAPVTRFSDPSIQYGLGVGYAGEMTWSTAVHEIGHAHGRSHAPCGGADGVDNNFPYSDGDTGVWGYNILRRQLLPPSSKDIMGYCEPTWISDYTYEGIARRTTTVQSSQRVLNKSNERWKVLIAPTGEAPHFSPADATGRPPGAEYRADVLAADGSVLTQVTVYRLALSDSEDAFIYMPAPESGWRALALPTGEVVALP